MSHRFRYAARVLAMAILGCLSPGEYLGAYEIPLSPATLHEAYVLGRRNDQATAEFLSPYIHACSTTEQCTLIAQVELLTPFAQIVDLSQRRATSNYTEQQATDDYHRRGDKIIVQFTLILPQAYATAQKRPAQENPPDDQTSTLRPENFWQNYRFNLKQNAKLIPSRSVHSSPVYSAPTQDKPSVLDGAAVFIEYEAKDVAQEDATVEIVTPEAKTLATTFELKKLR